MCPPHPWFAPRSGKRSAWRRPFRLRGMEKWCSRGCFPFVAWFRSSDVANVWTEPKNTGPAGYVPCFNEKISRSESRGGVPGHLPTGDDDPRHRQQVTDRFARHRFSGSSGTFGRFTMRKIQAKSSKKLEMLG